MYIHIHEHTHTHTHRASMANMKEKGAILDKVMKALLDAKAYDLLGPCIRTWLADEQRRVTAARDKE